MKLHYLAIPVLASVLIHPATGGQPGKSRLMTVLARYEFFTEKHVEVSAELQEHASSIDSLLKPYYYNYAWPEEVESTLKEANVGIYPISTNRVFVTWIDPNYETAKQYLTHCKETRKTPPIYAWGRHEARKYQGSVPELIALRKKYDDNSEVIEKLLLQDNEYRLAKEKVESITEDLRAREKAKQELEQVRVRTNEKFKNDPSFSQAVANGREILFQSNIQTLEYMINDYEKQNRFIPTAWMKL